MGLGANVKATNFISDLMVAGHKNDASKAKKELTDRGYTVIDQDLNDGGGGWYLYLGYKTSTNVADAITGLLVVSGSSYAGTENQTVTFDGASFQAIDYTNRTSGENYDTSGGNLNRGRGSSASDLYLYYTKYGNTTHVSGSRWKPITSLNVVASTTSQSVSTYVKRWTSSNSSYTYNQLEYANLNSGGSASNYIYVNMTGIHTCSLAYQLTGSAQHKLYCTVCNYTRSTANCTFSTNPYISAGAEQCYRQCTVCGLKTYTDHNWSGVYNYYSTSQCFTSCTLCNYQKKVSHTWAGWRQNGSSSHIHACALCSYTATEPHTWTYPSYDSSRHTQKCSVCLYYSQPAHNIVIDAAAVPATCTATGSTEAYHCSQCPYAITSSTIPALGHQFDEYGVCTQTAGEKHYSHGRGDINLDGRLSLGDVTKLVYVIHNSFLANADYDSDGEITVEDLHRMVNELIQAE